MPDQDSRADILARIVEALNRHNSGAVIRHFASDCVLDASRGPYPYGQRFTGRGAVEGAIRSFFDRVPDAEYRDVDIFFSGDRGIVLSRISGTAMTGERMDVRTCDIYEFEDEVIVRLDSYWKNAG